MTFRVILLPGAESDLEDAFTWIAEHSPDAAARWLAGIDAAISTLREMPLRCSVAGDDFGSEVVVRQMFYGRRHNGYRILFTLSEDTVYVLRIQHGARAPIRR
jgi:plasmid stabilization system protein ParE